MIFPLSAIVLLVFSCQTNPIKSKIQTYELGQPFELKVGQTALIKGENLKITFQTVEDYRCCMVCYCLWQGNAVVGLRVAAPARMLQTIGLNTDLEPKEVAWSGYKIKLNSLAPYPQDPPPLPTEVYVASLVVTKQ